MASEKDVGPTGNSEDREAFRQDMEHVSRCEQEVGEAVESADVAGVLSVLCEDVLYWATSLKRHMFALFRGYENEGAVMMRGGFVPHWLVRPLVGMHEAFEMLEFHKGVEYGRAFSQRMDNLLQARREFADFATSCRGATESREFAEFQAQVDDRRSALRKLAFSLARHLEVVHLQLRRPQKPAGSAAAATGAGGTSKVTAAESKPEGKPEVSLETVIRSFRFLRRWLTRRMLEAYEFRYSLPAVFRELAEREGKEEQDDSKAKGTPFVWLAGRTPRGTQGQIDAEIADIMKWARVSLKAGSKPIVEGIGIEAHVGRSAIGLKLYKGRILWADLQHHVPFWTLRAHEGDRLTGVLNSLVEWAVTSTPPAMYGNPPEQVRDKLVQALHMVRVNPYSHNTDFLMVAAGEMEDAQERLNYAEVLLGRWLLAETGRPRAGRDSAPVPRENARPKGTQLSREAGRHHRRLARDKEEFRAKVLLAIEHNNRLPKAERSTRRQICDVFGIILAKPPFGKSKKTNLKAIETWGRSRSGRRYLEQFRNSADGRLWISKLKEEGLPNPEGSSSNMSSD